MNELDRLRAILETAHDAFISMDAAGRVTRWNAKATEIFGFSREEAMGSPVAEMIIPERLREAHWRGLERFLATGEGRLLREKVKLTARRRDGSEFPVEMTISALKEDDQYGFHSCVADISGRRRMEDERDRLLLRLESMAKTDSLTGLFNRRAWDEELGRELARAHRGGYRFTVAEIDLDNFKQFNDHYGHQAGDEWLREAALAWTRELRVTDVIARLGGDEFAVLLPACPPDDVTAVTQRLRRISRPGRTFSIGSAAWDGQESAESVMQRADRALYEAKRLNRRHKTAERAPPGPRADRAS